MTDRDDIAAQTGADAAFPALPRRPDVTITPVRDDDGLRVWRHVGTSDRLVVCFSGVGSDPDQPPPLEFAKSATNLGRDHVLYIADPQRTWMNGPGLIEEIVSVVQGEVRQTGARDVFTLGNSMGGFAALVLGAFLPVRVALALSPQLSVDPAIVPEETRWRRWRDRIGAFRIPHALDATEGSATRHYVLFGSMRREAVQRDLLRPAANIVPFVLRGVGHDSALRLREAGILDEVVQLAFGGRTRALLRTLRGRFGLVPGPQAVGEIA